MSAGPVTAPINTLIVRVAVQERYSDASFEALGGCDKATGRWWRWELTADVKARLSNKGLSRRRGAAHSSVDINLLELVAMVVTAVVMVQGNKPVFIADPVLLRCDNSSCVAWGSSAGGVRDPRGAGLMRAYGALEAGCDWSFKAKHIKGVDNVLADTVSRVALTDVQAALVRLCPSPASPWKQATLPPLALELTLAATWQPELWGPQLWRSMRELGSSGSPTAL